jgi:hypothetical protein
VRKLLDTLSYFANSLVTLSSVPVLLRLLMPHILSFNILVATSISGGRHLHPHPKYASCRGDRDTLNMF